MAILRALTESRKAVVDRWFGGAPLPFSATEVTRISAWCCLLGAGARFLERVDWALAFLLIALVLDTVDGVVARRNGEHNPEVDWAADRFGEAVFVGALFQHDSLAVAVAFAGSYIANVFLPRWRIPVLPLRHTLAVYFIVLLARASA